jgi:hypothetical protein
MPAPSVGAGEESGDIHRRIGATIDVNAAC